MAKSKTPNLDRFGPKGRQAALNDIKALGTGDPPDDDGIEQYLSRLGPNNSEYNRYFQYDKTDSTQPANAGGKVSQAAKQAKSAKPKLLTIKKK